MVKKWIKPAGICLALLVLSSFYFSHPTSTPYEFPVPKGFPTPYIPEDNPLTQEKIALGKLLFFDPLLSKDRTVSCASCHQPQNAFSDAKPLSVGVYGQLGDRNSMPLVNLAWVGTFFWDGSSPTLEQQVLKPLTSAKEMGMSIEEIETRLLKDKKYKKLFWEVFGEKPSIGNISKAIASYERTLVSANSRYDRFFYGKDAMAFTDSEIRGYYLFMGERTHCASCHNGPNLGQLSFENNGLYENYADEGRSKITGLARDVGKFKVPSLRNIAKTAPYMHDGSLKTLEDVVMHYITGGKNHPNKSLHVHFPEDPSINETEIKDLINFLKTLTDDAFIENHQTSEKP